MSCSRWQVYNRRFNGLLNNRIDGDSGQTQIDPHDIDIHLNKFG